MGLPFETPVRGKTQERVPITAQAQTLVTSCVGGKKACVTTRRLLKTAHGLACELCSITVLFTGVLFVFILIFGFKHTYQ